jgi:hypothetical protein
MSELYIAHESDISYLKGVGLGITINYFVIYAELLAEETRLFYTDFTGKNVPRLLSWMLLNLIRIGLEVSKVGNCNQLEEERF